MDPLELLLECWFEVDVLAFLWTPGMIWLKKCPLWVDYSNTDPFLWTGCSRLLSCGLQMEPQVAPALAPSQRRSEILWLWMRARTFAVNCASLVLLMISGFQAVSPLCLLVLLVRRGGGGGGGVLLLVVWDRGERMTLRTAAPHFEVVQSLGCFVLPCILFEMWLQATSFPRRTTNVLAGLIWLPTDFTSFSVSLIHVWHFGLLNADNKIWKPLKHFGHLQRHKGTIFSIWWRMQKVKAWNQQRLRTELTVKHTFSDLNTEVWGLKQIKITATTSSCWLEAKARIKRANSEENLPQ